MLHNIAIMVMVFFYTCNGGCNSQKSNEMKSQIKTQTDVKHFKIVIINYYYGRAQYITAVTQDSLETIIDDLNGKQTREARVLRSDETAKMEKFLADFPLKSLEDKYIDEQVEDGTQIVFEISVNDAYKRIYVSNYYQDELGKLVEMIRPMMKKDYIGYRKEL